MKAKSIILNYCAALIFSSAFATQDTVKVGSFIINMGVTPQTYNNGLKPYGLLYELLKIHKVPVWWVINPSKTKDGIDFTHNGINYRGGTFIIPSIYMTSAVSTAVANWQAQGVVGTTTVSPFVVDVFMVLKFAPRWTLDKDNGNIALNFFSNAGIPSSAYGGNSSLGWKTPAQLDVCDDLFVMPHADPTWATHNNLYYWNQNFKGNIWAGCHAVSVIENTTDPGNTVKMNFLSTNGLVLFSAHGDGAKPFTYINPTDPVMQFMSSLDNAVDNGSEQQYLPLLSSAWRASSTVGVYASVHPNIPSLSAGLAANVVYGRGFGDNNRGYVMYQGGHDINKGAVAERVAAERVFFNYSFYSTTKTRDFDVVMSGAPPFGLINNSYNLSFTVPAYINLATYTIKWTTSGTGTFSPNDYSQNVTYTPTGSAGRADKVTATITDGCGREFASSNIIYMSGVLARSQVKLFAEKKSNDNIQLNWFSTDPNIYSFEIQKNEDNKGFVSVSKMMSTGGQQRYSYSDAIDKSTTLYRLKITDKTGYVYYSTIAKVNGAEMESSTFSVLSNPTNGSIRLIYQIPSAQQVYIDLIDMQGRIVSKNEMKLTTNSSLISFDLKSNITNGQYLVRIKTNSAQQILKVTVH